MGKGLAGDALFGGIIRLPALMLLLLPLLAVAVLFSQAVGGRSVCVCL